jgi:hypothetical protein
VDVELEVDDSGLETFGTTVDDDNVEVDASVV